MIRSAAALALILAATAAQAAEPIAVLDFRDDSGTIAARGGPARALRERVTLELRMHGFEVLGLEQLASKLSPAQMIVRPPLEDATVAEIGRASGARYLVTGTIAEYADAVGTRHKNRIINGGRMERVAEAAHLAVELEVRDARDGHVVHARHFVGESAAQNTELPNDSEEMDRQSRTGPGPRAIGDAAIDIGDFVACQLRRRDECLRNYAVEVPGP